VPLEVAWEVVQEIIGGKLLKASLKNASNRPQAAASKTEYQSKSNAWEEGMESMDAPSKSSIYDKTTNRNKKIKKNCYHQAGNLEGTTKISLLVFLRRETTWKCPNVFKRLARFPRNLPKCGPESSDREIYEKLVAEKA
jgi:hypothetical protein